MKKKQLIKAVSSHPKLFSFFAKMYNGIKLRNKLHAKGCKLSCGVSILNGLKIVSLGSGNEVVIGNFTIIKK